MLSRRTKIIIVLLILLLFIFLLYWFLLRGEGPRDELKEEAPPPPVALVPQNNVSQNTPPKEVTPAEKNKADITRLAAAFAERFGSYSNQGENANLLDLKPIMTARMQKWVDNFIEENAEEENDSTYYGVTTRAISSRITFSDKEGGRATVVVNTQREEAMGTMEENKNIFYENLEIDFIKINGEWKANEANWEE